MKYVVIMQVDGAIQHELVYSEHERDDAQAQFDKWINDDMLMEDGNVIVMMVPRSDALQESLDMRQMQLDMELYTR